MPLRGFHKKLVIMGIGNQRKPIRILLLAFLSFIAFSEIAFAVFFTCSQQQFSGTIEASAIAALATIFLIVIAYIGGEAIQNPRLLAWAKAELVQVFISITFVVLILFALSTFCNLKVSELKSMLGLSYMPKIYASNEGSDNLYTGAMRYVENLAALGLSNIHSLRYNAAAYEIRTSFSTFECKGICVFSLSSTSVSPFSGESINLAITNNLLSIATISYLSSLFQYFTLIYIYGGIFAFFLPLAIVIRSIPFMRHFGGSLIAIFISLYLLYPFMLLVNSFLVPGLIPQGKEVLLCSRDNSECKEADVFSTTLANSGKVACKKPGQSPCGGYMEWNMQDAKGDLVWGQNDMKKFKPTPTEKAVELNVLIFLASVFFPAMNFIVIGAFGRSLSRFIGEEADLSRLGQMI